MDELDYKILHFLEKDCKIQYHKIAEELKIGASTVHFRIKKMIKNGVIKGFCAIVDPDKLSYTTRAWIGLSVNPRKIKEIAQILSSYDEVQIVASAAGDHDIIIQIIARDQRSLWNFINEKIKTIDGIEKNFHVSTFLDVYKYTHTIT